MISPKEYNQSMYMEQGVEVSITAKEHTKLDFEKPYNEREYLDGTYDVVVDLSSSDESKLNHSLTIILSCGGRFEFGLDGGWFGLVDEYTGDEFYTEYRKRKNLNDNE